MAPELDKRLFPARLREFRAAVGWTQAELAAKLGISQQGLAHWENGVRLPTLDTYWDLCMILEKSQDDFTRPAKKKGKRNA